MFEDIKNTLANGNLGATPIVDVTTNASYEVIKYQLANGNLGAIPVSIVGGSTGGGDTITDFRVIEQIEDYLLAIETDQDIWYANLPKNEQTLRRREYTRKQLSQGFTQAITTTWTDVQGLFHQFLVASNYRLMLRLQVEKLVGSVQHPTIFSVRIFNMDTGQQLAGNTLRQQAIYHDGALTTFELDFDGFIPALTSLSVQIRTTDNTVLRLASGTFQRQNLSILDIGNNEELITSLVELT